MGHSVSDNDGSASKPCLTPGSSTDEDFVGGTSVLFAAECVWTYI